MADHALLQIWKLQKLPLICLPSSLLCGGGVEENGRVYPSFGKYEYGIPIDEEEMDRNDLQHHKFFLLLDHKLYLAPIPDFVFEEPGSRILDVGTGTGVWAIDMADKFPNAEIVGNDIAATQPSFVPPNCIFEIEDAEDDWPYPAQSFDYVHVRELLYAIRDYPRLIAQAYNITRPGGWVELAMTVPDVYSDDDSLPPNSAIKEAGAVFLEIGEKMGAPPTAARKWKSQLADAGFVNIHDTVLKIPTSPWPKEKATATRRRNGTLYAVRRPSLHDPPWLDAATGEKPRRLGSLRCSGQSRTTRPQKHPSLLRFSSNLRTETGAMRPVAG